VAGTRGERKEEYHRGGGSGFIQDMAISANHRITGRTLMSDVICFRPLGAISLAPIRPGEGTEKPAAAAVSSARYWAGDFVLSKYAVGKKSVGILFVLRNVIARQW
jgi:hypothetical protein